MDNFLTNIQVEEVYHDREDRHAFLQHSHAISGKQRSDEQKNHSRHEEGGSRASNDKSKTLDTSAKTACAGCERIFKIEELVRIAKDTCLCDECSEAYEQDMQNAQIEL